MNNTGKILGMIAIFVVFAVVGYIIPIENMIGKQNSKPIVAEQQTANDSASALVAAIEPEKQTEPQKAVEPQPLPEPEPVAQAVEAVAEEAVVDTSNVPEITYARVSERSSQNFKKIGLGFTAKATVPSKAPLKYELYEKGEQKAKYSSSNGQFSDVYPNDSGSYTLRVTNKNTGDYTTRLVKGFNKLPKWDAAKLQQELMQTSPSRLFFCHFNHDELRFVCNGIDQALAPTDISMLTMNISAMQWKIEVVGDINYDEFNRITFFTLNITETM